MRKPVAGTVARGMAWTDEARYLAWFPGDTLFVTDFPVPSPPRWWTGARSVSTSIALRATAPRATATAW